MKLQTKTGRAIAKSPGRHDGRQPIEKRHRTVRRTIPFNPPVFKGNVLLLLLRTDRGARAGKPDKLLVASGGPR